ncbi:hypothetical protein BJL90_02945 [Clostridium formicaceticum]|uniref:Uncharacterized protein n=1 Tax=Clostridium formicaceticum TaxID=1497 RepID=A0ABN4T1P7_9CLOT|nr:hypothetical protein BJL90_02945 [Clostridium formicaceticum]
MQIIHQDYDKTLVRQKNIGEMYNTKKLHLKPPPPSTPFPIRLSAHFLSIFHFQNYNKVHRKTGSFMSLFP